MPVSADEKPVTGDAGKRVNNTWTKEKQKEKDNNGDKEKAKSVISKFVSDDTSRNSSALSPYGGLRTNDKYVL